MNERLRNIRRRIMRELEDEEKVDLKGKKVHFNRNEENPVNKQGKNWKAAVIYIKNWVSLMG